MIPFVSCQPVAADLVMSSICRSNFHFSLRAVCQCAPNWSFWGLSRAAVNHMAALCSLGWWEVRNDMVVVMMEGGHMIMLTLTRLGRDLNQFSPTNA